MASVLISRTVVDRNKTEYNLVVTVIVTTPKNGNSESNLDLHLKRMESIPLKNK